jgi:signal transduction histidine kinase
MRDRFAPRAAECGRAILTAGAGPLVDADPDRLEQALGNLVDNALRYGAGSVRISSRVAGPRVELHVEDEGQGFPDSFLARAFDRFSRADEARSSGGAGLGLSIVELIAAAHGGAVGATNRPEGGADVWIAMPLARAAPTAPAAVDEATAPAANV